MTLLEHKRTGSGPPLLLVHGIGSWGRCWDPVVPLLAPHRHVVTVDLPGFGASPMRPGQDMSPPGLARTLVEFLAAIGLERPHVAGSSLGGWIGLEMARLGAVASVTGISPAGLWRSPPAYMRAQIRLLRKLPLLLGEKGIEAVAAVPPVRWVSTANFFGRPWRLTRAEAAAQVQQVRLCAGFETVLYAAEHRRFVGGMTIDVPVTVAFGRRDVIFGDSCRRREELPAQTRWVDPPSGWGHVPFWDDPRGIADLLLAGSATSVPAVRRAVAS
jgi:pimeloyl-ACP methyl ester carboxylesterase